MQVKDLKKMLKVLDDEDEIIVCPPPMEEMREYDGMLEITKVSKYNGLYIIETEI